MTGDLVLIVPMPDDLHASAVVYCLLRGMRPVDIILSIYIIKVLIK